MRKELVKKVILKEMEEYTDLAGIEVDTNVKNVLEYLYNKTNRDGFVYMSIRDMVLECDLNWGETKEALMANVKWLLCDLEDVVLAEYSAEQIEAIKDLDELLILELLPEFK